MSNLLSPSALLQQRGRWSLSTCLGTAAMRRTAALLSRHGGGGGGSRGIPQALSDVLVCPLSKKPLRYCEASDSLVSDAVSVSFPVVDGIPSLVPKDGKLLEDHQENSEQESNSSSKDFSG